MARAADVKVKLVPLVLSGQKKLLRYDFNAFIELEELAKAENKDPEKEPTITDTLERVQKGDLKALRHVVWAGLLHTEPDITLKDVGKLFDMDDLGDVMEAVNKALTLALPKIDEVEAEAEAQEQSIRPLA